MSGVTADKVNSKSKATSAESKAPTTESKVKRVNVVSRALRAAAASPVIWAIITCTILLISGLERYWRDGDFWGKAITARESPFPLVELPKQIGTWHFQDGSESTLDPDIATVAGATSNILRRYVDTKSEQTADVVITYGLAKWMIGHSPDYCYPYSGFQKVESMGEYELKLDAPPKVLRYRGGGFTKARLGIAERVQVIYSLRSGDEWLTDANRLWKTIRQNPGMFKVQISGPPSADLSIESSPSVQLLGELTKEIEKRLPKTSPSAASAVASNR
jgi:hypothetical protein